MAKVAVLCNNRMAIPALQTLYSQGKLCAVGVPVDNSDVIDFCMMLEKQSQIPFIMIQKENLFDKIDEFVTRYDAQYVFTMTFPWKIPDMILNKYPKKFYNFHYGLLPEMRGADPVFESIRSGAGETGITVHHIENKIDTGTIILKKTIPLTNGITHGTLCTNLAWLGSGILPELLNSLQSNKVGQEQDETKARYYKKPGLDDVCISWNKSDARTIESLSRACNPWNKGAYTQWNGWNIRVVEATVVNHETDQSHPPGTIITLDEKNGLIVKCNNETHLRVDIIYTDEGFMSGYKLLSFGVKKGSSFVSLKSEN
ncbi:formyltransferase family protein [Chryseobacterium echinoideorum]|uniref:formyltransferase family protein n=1 Tax=Chryseobacterium echinoideorum TaxID=1549648 RepID=UPI0016253A08|nr:formyltransferase family protein [Chryseobacterium echinoideorum]